MAPVLEVEPPPPPEPPSPPSAPATLLLNPPFPPPVTVTKVISLPFNVESSPLLVAGNGSVLLLKAPPSPMTIV